MTDEQWKKLDRQPSEFKKGDIVRRYQEEYCEIREISSSGKTFVVGDPLTGVRRFNKNQCDLICPVEWRLN